MNAARVFAATAVAGLALAAARPAAADLPPPDGEKFVGYQFKVTGIPAGAGRVLVAYPCGTSNGAPIAEFRRLEEGTPVDVGRRGGTCEIYAVEQAAFDAFAASYQPSDVMGHDPAVDALTGAGVKCAGGPQPQFVLPSRDDRDVIAQAFAVAALDATTCTLTAAAGNAAAAPAPAQTGCRGCAAPGDATGPLALLAIFGGGAVLRRRRR